MSRTQNVLISYGIFALIYIGLALLDPIEQSQLARLQITRLQANLLLITIIAPLLSIWLAAFYGYARFKDYAEHIHGTRDGDAFSYIANGLGVLALSLPVTSIVSSIFNYFGDKNPDLIPSFTIISNYFAIGFAFVAFMIIYRGAKSLSRVVSARKAKFPRYIRYYVFLAALSLLYIYLTFTNPIRHQPNKENQEAIYYLPDWLILFTVVIPYIIIWLIGLRAFLYIKYYQRRVKGELYKKSLKQLSFGLGGVVVISIVLQYLTAFTSVFDALSLQPLLATIYLLLVVYAVGFILIALGAKKLKKIEEV